MTHDLGALKAFQAEHIYRHPHVAQSMGRAKQVVAELFAAFSADPALLPADWSAACGAHFETVDESPQELGRAQSGAGQYSLAFFKGMSSAGSVYEGVADTTIQRGAPNLGKSEFCTSKGGSTQRSCLLRWDLSSIPSTAKVEGAVLEVTVADPSRGTFRLFDVRRSWTEDEATFKRPHDGAAWGLPGANSTVDAGSTPLGAFVPRANGALTIPLNAAGVAVVQGWVKEPASNAGLKIYNPRPFNGTSIASSDWGVVAERPKLVVVLAN